MKHTPGPLNIVKRGMDLNGHPIHSSIEVDSPEGSRVIALIMDCAEADANAQLIAAGPDLLAALQETEGYLGDYPEIAALRDAAIAKAVNNKSPIS